MGKVTDIRGPYLTPPENGIVLCVEEESQIQALDRNQPILPMHPGLVKRRSHDCVRHATATPFAALDIATGQVTASLKPLHRNQEFLVFLKQVERAYRHAVDAQRAAGPATLGDGQLRRSQARESQVVVGRQSPVCGLFRTDPRYVDEPRRSLIRHRRTPGHPTRSLHLGQGPQCGNPSLHLGLE